MENSAGDIGGRRLLLDAAADDEFDTNMVIILAALLAALICALGLNSIVRCAMRCGDQTAEEEATGVKKRDLRRIHVASYPCVMIKGSTDCAICLADFAEGDKVRVLPMCNHGFHVACIDRWLASNSSCPICRHSLLRILL